MFSCNPFFWFLIPPPPFKKLLKLFAVFMIIFVISLGYFFRDRSLLCVLARTIIGKFI